MTKYFKKKIKYTGQWQWQAEYFLNFSEYKKKKEGASCEKW